MKYDLIKIMDDLNLPYKAAEHEPIIDYETAHRVDEEHGLHGAESKDLVLKGKSGKYYVMVTEEGVRFDRNFMKELLGEKVGIISPEELEEKTGYIVGCAPSFGYDSDFTIIVDDAIFKNENFVVSAGILTRSFVMKTEDLKKVYESVPNKIIYTTLPR